MSRIFRYKKFLNENPNLIKYNKKKIPWFSENSATFAYYDGVFFISDTSNNQTTHEQLKKKAIKYFSKKDEWNDKETIELNFIYKNISNRGKYGGRIFLDSKIISFWEFPENKEKLKEIVLDIEKNLKKNGQPLNVSIWDDEEYKIEILLNNFLERDINGTPKWSGESQIIKLQDYIDSRKRPEKELKSKHEEPPMVKSLKMDNDKDNVWDFYKHKGIKKYENFQDIIGEPIKINKSLYELRGKKIYDPFSDCYIEVKNTFKLIDSDDDSVIYEYPIPIPGQTVSNTENHKMYLDLEIEFIHFMDEFENVIYEMDLDELEEIKY